jgi:hypothetical protein
MAGLVPAIHVFTQSRQSKTWMPGIADKFTQSAQARLLWPGMTIAIFHSLQSVIAMARSACRSRTDNFSVSDFNWPQAARMSRPRGVRTGEE